MKHPEKFIFCTYFMPKIAPRIIVSIIVLALLAAGAAFFLNRPVTEAPVTGDAIAGTITVTTDDGEGSLQTFTAPAPEGSTAFSVLESALGEANVVLESKAYGDLGILVEKIGDVAGGEAGRYWQYYVNGEYGTIAADKKEVRAGDLVEWKFLGPNEQ